MRSKEDNEDTPGCRADELECTIGCKSEEKQKGCSCRGGGKCRRKQML